MQLVYHPLAPLAKTKMAISSHFCECVNRFEFSFLW